MEKIKIQWYWIKETNLKWLDQEGISKKEMWTEVWIMKKHWSKEFGVGEGKEWLQG